MNINGDLDLEPEKKESPATLSPRRLNFLQRVIALIVDDPVVRLTPYQFRLEPGPWTGGPTGKHAGCVLVCHVRERRGRFEVALTEDQVIALRRIFSEVLR